MQTDGAITSILDALENEEGHLAPKKRLVVQSAVLCFAETGFAGTSTRMIADRAGVAEATIFRHFGTKKALLLRITSPVLKRLLAPAIAQEARAILENTHDDVRSFIRTIMLSRLGFADNYAPLVRIVIQELPVNADLREIVFTAFEGVFGDVLLAAIQKFQERGQLMQMPPDRLLRMFMSLLAGYYITRTMLAPGDWDDAAEVEAMLDFALSGVSQAGAPGIRAL